CTARPGTWPAACARLRGGRAARSCGCLILGCCDQFVIAVQAREVITDVERILPSASELDALGCEIMANVGVNEFRLMHVSLVVVIGFHASTVFVREPRNLD